MTNKKDDTAGQPRRASDSRPRPGSGTPASDRSGKPDAAPAKSPTTCDKKPSSSWSPIDPGRPTK